MIVKKIKQGQRRKTTKNQYVKSLINYVFARSAHAENDKVSHFGSRNFLTETLDAQLEEMLAVIEGAPRSSCPVNHWVLSWKGGEKPTNEQFEEVVDIFITELGLQKHLVLYACHQNTEKQHLHLIINRIDPDTYQSIKVEKGFDIEIAHRAIAKIEHKQGWASEERARYFVDEAGKVIRTRTTCPPGERVKKAGRAKSWRAEAVEVRQGGCSAESQAQAIVERVINHVAGWREWHRALADFGLRYDKSGSGAVIRVGAVEVKASSAHRRASLTQLERRWGAYQSGTEVGIDVGDEGTTVPTPVLDPAGRTSVPEPNQGRQDAEKKRGEDIKRVAREKLAEQQKQVRERLRKLHAEQRQALFQRTWVGRGIALRALQSVLAREQAAERARLKNRQAGDRAALHSANPPLWGGLMPGRFVGMGGIDLTPVDFHVDIRGFYPVIQSDGTVFYQDAIGRLSFSDVGEKIYAHTSDLAAVLAMLQLAAAKWGAIEVFGEDKFKQMCAAIAWEHGIVITNPEFQHFFTEEEADYRYWRNSNQRQSQSPTHDSYAGWAGW